MQWQLGTHFLCFVFFLLARAAASCKFLRFCSTSGGEHQGVPLVGIVVPISVSVFVMPLLPPAILVDWLDQVLFALVSERVDAGLVVLAAAFTHGLFNWPHSEKLMCVCGSGQAQYHLHP